MAGGRDRHRHRAGKRVSGRDGRGGLKGNPLFEALNGVHDSKNSSPRTNRNEKVNELTIRLGLAKRESTVPTRDTRKKIPLRNDKKKLIPTSTRGSSSIESKNNPLAVALGLGRLPSGPAPKAAKRNDRRNDIKSNSTSNLSSNTNRNNDNRNRNQGRNTTTRNTQQNSANIQPQQRVPQQAPIHTSNNAPSRSQANNLTFKNASLIPFLRIENLDSTVNETDIRMVLSAKLGPTLKIIKMNTIYAGNPAVTAEVFFLNENKLQEYAQILNDIVADGNSIKATIAYHSNIINSDKLWESVLKEVRMIKQEVIRQNPALK